MLFPRMLPTCCFQRVRFWGGCSTSTRVHSPNVRSPRHLGSFWICNLHTPRQYGNAMCAGWGFCTSHGLRSNSAHREIDLTSTSANHPTLQPRQPTQQKRPSPTPVTPTGDPKVLPSHVGRQTLWLQRPAPATTTGCKWELGQRRIRHPTMAPPRTTEAAALPPCTRTRRPCGGHAPTAANSTSYRQHTNFRAGARLRRKPMPHLGRHPSQTEQPTRQLLPWPHQGTMDPSRTIQLRTN